MAGSIRLDPTRVSLPPEMVAGSHSDPDHAPAGTRGGSGLLSWASSLNPLALLGPSARSQTPRLRLKDSAAVNPAAMLESALPPMDAREVCLLWSPLVELLSAAETPEDFRPHSLDRDEHPPQWVCADVSTMIPVGLPPTVREGPVRIDYWGILTAVRHDQSHCSLSLPIRVLDPLSARRMQLAHWLDRLRCAPASPLVSVSVSLCSSPRAAASSSSSSTSPAQPSLPHSAGMEGHDSLVARQTLVNVVRSVGKLYAELGGSVEYTIRVAESAPALASITVLRRGFQLGETVCGLVRFQQQCASIVVQLQASHALGPRLGPVIGRSAVWQTVVLRKEEATADLSLWHFMLSFPLSAPQELVSDLVVTTWSVVFSFVSAQGHAVEWALPIRLLIPSHPALPRSSFSLSL